VGVPLPDGRRPAVAEECRFPAPQIGASKEGDERAASDAQWRHESNLNWSHKLLKNISREIIAFAPI